MENPLAHIINNMLTQHINNYYVMLAQHNVLSVDLLLKWLNVIPRRYEGLL